MAEKPFAAAAERNAAAILEVLRSELRSCSRVLEIGSGTGQHAVRFAAELDHIEWQTSDVDQNLPGIAAWVAESGLENVGAPWSFDVRNASVEPASFNGVFSANTSHIMSFDRVTDMFALAGQALQPAGVFCLYGPFRKGGRFNTASNAQFDQSLRSRHPQMAIRDLEALDELASEHRFARESLYAMPSNNFLAVWRKESRK